MYPQGAANSRYLYYPDHLVKLPSQELSLQNIIQTIRSYFTEPLWNDAITAGMAYAQKMQTAKNVHDTREMETDTGGDEKRAGHHARRDSLPTAPGTPGYAGCAVSSVLPGCAMVHVRVVSFSEMSGRKGRGLSGLIVRHRGRYGHT